MLKKFLITIILPLSILFSSNILADVSIDVDKVLEKAREVAKKSDKIAKILKTEPDQAVRLSVFDQVVVSGTDTQRQIAIDTSLASADKLLKAAAFKAAILDLDRLHITLVINPDSSANIQKKSKSRIDKSGDQYVFPVKKGADSKKGIFGDATYAKGEIIGTHVSFTWLTSASEYASGVLELEGDNKVVGKISLQKGKEQYIGTAKIR